MEKIMHPEGLLVLYTYNAYANQLLFDTVEKLSETEYTQQSSPSHGSVKNLIEHMLACEASFLMRCQGKTPDFASLDVSTLDSLKRYWRELEREQAGFIGALTEGDCARDIKLLIREQTLVLPVWQLLTQAVIHSIHHRGELSIVLTGLGHPLPTLDIILQFVKESGQKW